MKSVYGHPAAARHAQRGLRETLVTNGPFVISSFDACLYHLVDEKESFHISTHVDDMIATGTQGGQRIAIDCLQAVFEIEITKEPSMVLGVTILRDKKTKKTLLHQHQYTKDLLEQEQMDKCNEKPCPMVEGVQGQAKLMHDHEELHENMGSEAQLRRIVGKLMWLAIKTRPDIMYSVNFLARFCTTASETQIKWAKRILAYLKGTSKMGISIDGNVPLQLQVSADSDWGSDPKTCRSTTGIHITLGGATVVAASKLQRRVSDSVGMAETYAAHAAVQYVPWLLGLTNEFNLDVPRPVPVYVDNSGVVSQAQEASRHRSSRHYRLPQAMIREMQATGIIMAVKVNTEDNVADFFTKPLVGKRFRRHRDAIMGQQFQ